MTVWVNYKYLDLIVTKIATAEKERSYQVNLASIAYELWKKHPALPLMIYKAKIRVDAIILPFTAVSYYDICL